MTTKKNYIGTLVVVSFNDTIVITTQYSLGNVLFNFIKLHTKFDWGEIRIELSDSEFKNIKVVTKEYNNTSAEPATIIVEKLLLLENYTTDKNILLVVEPPDSISKKFFYEKLLKDVLYIPSPNNLNSNTIEHNDTIIHKFKKYLTEYYSITPTDIQFDYFISYFKKLIIWTPSNGYSLFPNFDNKMSKLISSYIKDESSKWIEQLMYNISSYINFTNPIYSLYHKLNSSKKNIKLITINDFVETLQHLPISKDEYESLSNILDEYKITQQLENYISKSLNQIYKTDEYQRDLKLYRYIENITTDINIQAWCPIFIIPINDNLVITSTKIASSFLIENYHNTNKDVLLNTPIYDRSIFSFAINKDSIPMGTVEHVTESKEIQSNILQKYDDITTNIDKEDTIYILYRNPIDRYLQSIYQDLKEYLRDTYNIKGSDSILTQYISFIKNTPNDKNLIKILKRICTENEDIVAPHDLLKNFSHINEINDIVKNIIDGLLDYFFTQESFEKNLENDITISNIWKTTSRFNVVSPHYTPYLTNVLELYNNSNNKLKFKFVDIDVENIINIIFDKEASNIIESDAITNRTSTDFKTMWKDRVAYYLNMNPNINQSVNHILNSDIIAYNSIKNLKNNNQEHIHRHTPSYINYKINILLASMNDDIVITTQKIASTWLIENYFKLSNNIHTISDKFGAQLNEQRSSFTAHLNTVSGNIEFLNTNYQTVPQPDSFNLIQNKNTTRLSNILNGKHSGNIYILYRNPEYRYINALQEDINTYLQNISDSNPTALLNFYLSFIKNKPSNIYDIYEKIIYDMTDYMGNNFCGGIYDLTKYITIRIKKDNTPGLKDLHLTILDGVLNWFFNSTGPIDTSSDNPFGEINKSMDDTTTHIPIIFRNHITQHYTPYLSQMLDYYESLGRPNYIRFLDIDTEDINNIILKKTDKGNMPNKTSDVFKDAWKLLFAKHLESNPKIRTHISNHLLPDVVAYNRIKNIKK